MASKPILYSYFRSSASWRVRIALAYKGIDYEYRPISLIKDGGEQHTPEYQKLNPMEQVPTLIIDGLALTQSIPIIEYLDETRPKNTLLPSNPGKRAQARKLAEIVNAGIQPIQNLSVLQKLAAVTGDDQQKAVWGHYWIDRGFQVLEAELQETVGRYCVGDEVTIADLCLVPQLYNAKRFKVDMNKYPTIAKVAEELLKLPAFQSADPTAQPDCPADLK